MNFFKRLFGKKTKEEEVPEDFTDEQYEQDYEDKQAGLENLLGKMHDLVGHSIIPFSLGGAVDMYYFPNHIKGTGFATMELLDPDGNGPMPNRIGTYELVAFTKYEYVNTEDVQLPFNLIQNKICGIFTTVASYSFEDVLNPNETCEMPGEEGEENICLVFDVYRPGDKEFNVGQRKHHLLLCIQIFKSEMEFAMENGSEELFVKLKDAGFYPYSDLDRPPVV
jgi:hypothetical protein